MKTRIILALIALIALSSVALAYFYFQLHLGLPPCPLCILDRIILLILGGACLVMLLVRGLGLRLMFVFSALLVLAGLIVGGRHIWLERAPRQSSGGCVPQDQAADLLEWLTSAFIGTSDCSIVFWRLAGLSLADWTFILYVLLAALLLLASPFKKNS